VSTADKLTETSKYELLRPLGRGGMGEVYLGRDTRLNRDVAIKVMRVDLPEGNWQERLQQEARLLAQLNHPNIVQIYDIIEHDGSPALVMEYVEGRNLHLYLREHRVELGDKLRWLSEISAGLAASHAAGIAHCDLKAENVLIDSRGTAKVTDFGIASSARGMDEDMLSLGRLAQQLLEPHREQLPLALPDLLRQLQHRAANKRPESRQAAEIFRLAWHEYSQDDTPLPQDLSPARRAVARPTVYALVLVASLALVALLYFNRAPAQQHYVAVMPTVLSEAAEERHRQVDYLRSAVQQALLQNVIEGAGLALVSFTESAAAQGTPAELLSLLGADSLVSSTLNCDDLTCDLHLERLEAPEGTVTRQQTLALLIDSPLAAHDTLQRQWHHLFSREEAVLEASDAIDETHYRRYLELSLASERQSLPATEILQELELLLPEAERFLPLYLLYTTEATALYEYMGDSTYLDRLERVLDRAESRAGHSLFILESRFRLEVNRGNLEQAAAVIEQVRSEFADEVMTSYLTGELLFNQNEFELADRHYARAATLQPSEKHLYARARNLFFGADLEAAGAVLEQLLRRHPYRTAALGLKGIILLEQGRLDDAIATFEKSLAIQPNPLQRANLGTAYMFRRDYESARDILEAGYRGGSRDSALVLNLADCEMMLGNRDRASALYRSVVERHQSGDPSVLPETAAQAYAQLGQFEDALRILKNMKSRWENTPAYALSAALVYTLAGQNIAALVEVDGALDQGVNPFWFDLEWFDALCVEVRFRERIAAAGNSSRCD